MHRDRRSAFWWTCAMGTSTQRAARYSQQFCVFTDGARPYREFLECLAHVDRIATSGSEGEIRKCTFDGISSCSFAGPERLLGDKLFSNLRPETSSKMRTTSN